MASKDLLLKNRDKPVLVAHIVPGYFAAIQSKPYWQPSWSSRQRALLWMVAVGSPVAPDLDVIYNVLFRGFSNHSTLWTHSLFVHVIPLLVWWILQRIGRWPYLQTLMWLAAIGGLSHLLLDVIAHSTPLLYPFSMTMFGIPPQRVVEGGVWAYLTDPIFLFEPCLLTLAAIHWAKHHLHDQRTQRAVLVILVTGLSAFIVGFLLLLPILQEIAVSLT